MNAAFRQLMDQLDDESDSIKEKFDAAEIALLPFTKQFTQNRKQFHLLAIKQEKCNTLLFQ